jgi:uncharacterized protein (TIGR02186 family)
LSAFLAGLVLLAASTAFGQTAAQPAAEKPSEEIQMGISTDTIPITSDFAGTKIAVFGTIENPDKIGQVLNEYSIVVAITGPLENVVIRRKERVFGIWMNRVSRTYRAVPSFYALATNRPLDAVAPVEELRARKIGINNISFNLFSTASQTFILPAPDFANSLRRIREEKSLYTENPKGVVFLGSTLFRATLDIPSNAPIGDYTVTAYLFRDGGMLAKRDGHIRVERAGLEKGMYTLAHVYSYWYGIIAVLGALATGWLASVIFGRN